MIKIKQCLEVSLTIEFEFQDPVDCMTQNEKKRDTMNKREKIDKKRSIDKFRFRIIVGNQGRHHMNKHAETRQGA